MNYPEERKAKVASFFAQHATHWYSRYGTSAYADWDYQLRGRIALEWLGKSGQSTTRRLLEIGCGAGVQSVAAVRQGWEVISVDFAEGMLSEARRHSAEPVWIAAAVEALPFRPRAYDAVLMNGVIGYLKDPLQALHTVREQLRPGGKLIISWASPPPLLFEAVSRTVSSVPDKVYLTLKRMVTRRGAVMPVVDTGFYQQYLRRWTPEEFYTLLQSAGFAIQQVRSQNFGRLQFMDRTVWPERVDIQLSEWLDHLAGTAPHRRLRDGARTHIALVMTSSD